LEVEEPGIESEASEASAAAELVVEFPLVGSVLIFGSSFIG
jgi:hypothetical protein